MKGNLSKTLMAFALAGSAVTFAGVPKADKKAKTAVHEQSVSNSATREQKARRQVAEDLHWRGSNISPVLTGAPNWQR